MTDVQVTVIETLEKIVDVPVVKQIEVPQVQMDILQRFSAPVIERNNLTPFLQVQTIEKIVEIPLVAQQKFLGWICTNNGLTLP